MLNKKLEDLYKSKYEELSRELKKISNDKDKYEDKPTSPLLIKVKEEEYINSDIKIMIFGQETNDWVGLDNNMSHILNVYDDFFNKEGYKKHGGQFWNAVSNFIKRIKEKYPNKSIEFLWNNIVKIGKCSKGLPSDDIREIEYEKFKVIPKEIEILKPNVIIFFTGPNYESILKDNFENIINKKIDGFTERQLSEIELDNINYSFRTYHPHYLYRIKAIDKYFDAIIEKINF